MPAKTPRAAFKHSLECLEDRIAPATIVGVAFDVATGELTVTGSEFQDDVQFVKTGKTSYRLEALGNSAFSVNGQEVKALDFPKVLILNANLGNGPDTFTLENADTLAALNIQMGGGDDVLNFRGATTVKGNMALNLGPTLQDGVDKLTLGGTAITVGGNLTVDALGGSEVAIEANTLSVKKDWLHTTGDSADLLQFNATSVVTVGGGTQWDLGAGDNSISAVDAKALNFGKFASGLSKGAGLVLNSSGFLVLDLKLNDLNSAGYWRVNGGAGSEAVSIQVANAVKVAGRNVDGYSLVYDGPAGTSWAMLGSDISMAGGVLLTGEANTSVNFSLEAENTVKLGKAVSGASLKGEGGNTFLAAVRGETIALAGSADVAFGTAFSNLELRGTTKLSVGANALGQSIKLSGTPSTTNTSQTLLLSGGAVQLSGGLELAMGSGLNSTSISGGTGASSIGKLKSGPSVKYTGGSGDDSLSLSGAAVKVTSYLDLDLSLGEQVFLDRNRFTTNAGTLKIGKSAAGVSVETQGGKNVDLITLKAETLTLAGGISAKLGDNGADNDANSVTVQSRNASIGAAAGVSVLLQGADFDDTIEFSKGSFNTAVNFKLAGGLFVTGGAGEAEVTLSAQNVSVGKGPAAANGVSIQVQSSVGSSALNFTGGVLNVAGPVFVGATQDASLNIAAEMVKLGAVNSPAFGPVSLGLQSNLGTLSATITAGNAALAGGVLIVGDASQAATFKAAARQSLAIGGGIIFNGGAGDDQLELTAPSAKLGSIRAALGDGFDTVDLQLGGTIAGDVTLNLGASVAVNGREEIATLASFYAQEGLLKLGGKLTLESSGTGALLTTLRYVSVAQEIALTNGDGSATFTIDGLTAQGTLTLNAGGGQDTLRFETASQYGISTVAKEAVFNLGTGNDLVSIGQAPVSAAIDNRVVFKAAVTLDGGEGTDTLRPDSTNTTVNSFAVAVTPVSFELDGTEL